MERSYKRREDLGHNYKYVRVNISLVSLLIMPVFVIKRQFKLLTLAFT